ncbi:MAG: sigma-70 family RNA polymerase sigma factor [Polyangiales bacterium]
MEPIDATTSAYISRVNALPALQREDELALAQAYLAGDASAGHRVVAANLRHVVPIALRYRRYGVPVGELIAEGNLALLRALAGFEPSRGLRFATYANYWIRADVLALILRQRSMVGGGRGHLRPKYFFRLRREHARLSLQLGDATKVHQALSERWQLSPEELAEIFDRLEQPDASLEAPIARESRTSMAEVLPAPERTQEDLLSRERTRAALEKAVRKAASELDARERFILEHRLLADPEAEYSLVRIGLRFGVSRERARQLETRVKEKLRNRLAGLIGPSELVAHLGAA